MQPDLGTSQLLAEAPAALWPLAAPLTRDGATQEAVKQVRDAIVARPNLPPAVRADHLAVLRLMAGAEELPSSFFASILEMTC